MLSSADTFVCKAGHLAFKKKYEKNKGENAHYKYFFDVKKCKVCPLKDGCYKEGAKTKTYSIRILENEYTNQETFQQSDYFKEKMKERYKIEAKNGEIKNRHGYDVAKYSGLIGMELQGAMTIFVANIKRIIKLLG